MQFIAQQLNIVQGKVREFETKYGREENTVKLLAVSKTRSVEEILEAVECGQVEFGENYQQEAITKIETLAPKNIVWHFIGPLQANKAQHIAKHFAWIHTVDRLKIAQRLSILRPRDMPDLNVCVQFNVSGEPSKSGVTSGELMPLVEEISLFTTSSIFNLIFHINLLLVLNACISDLGKRNQIDLNQLNTISSANESSNLPSIFVPDTYVPLSPFVQV